MIKDNKQYRILIVEDNPGDFLIAEDFLTEQILEPVIVQAVSFKQASEILVAADISFDIILLDLSLPDINGKELINEMLRIASSCPIIILTGYTDISFSVKSIARGVLDYLLKDELNATLLYKSIVYSIERKKAIAELIESERRYSNLFHLSPQPMWLFDVETYRFTQVNKAATLLYGYSEEEFLNMTLMDIKLEEDINKTKEAFSKPNNKDEIFKDTIRHCKKSGEVIEVEIYSNPIIIHDKNYRSVIAIDVTERNLNEHKITKAIIKTQEDERYELGGELHDNVCQILAASQLSLGMLKQSLPESRLPLFNMCKDNISLALEEIRNLSHRLAPAFFAETTLEEAFSRLFDTFNIENKIELKLNFDKTVNKRTISLDIQLNLYRILQEQLRNIEKYAKATLIEVNVIIHNNKIKMRVSDNGIGFNVHKAKTGIGLANMKRRAELFSGKFKIESILGTGSTVMVDIPLTETV